jgi:heat-inducible transcriptional repressor
MKAPALTDREREILAAVVRQYIEAGDPVSSLRLTHSGLFGVSSATLRHGLSSLETKGYLRQPHTSAGRVPTDVGYRAYVDSLLEDRHRRRPRPRVGARLGPATTVDDVLSSVSHELSRLSHHVGFAVAPAADEGALRQIEFVSLGASRVLVIVVTAGGQVSHKVVEPGESLGPAELQRAANYVNTEFGGLPMSRVRQALVDRLRQERVLCDALLARALRLTSATLDELSAPGVVHVQGTATLLAGEEGPDAAARLATLRALITMVEDKDRLVRLLNAYIDGPGIRIVIGAEHVAPDLRPLSLVASTYGDSGHGGTVGVIGPTRMHYYRAIAAVDGMVEALDRLLPRTRL